MAMSALDLEILEQLARYIAGDISLGAFREWFSPLAWNIDRRADAHTVRIVHDIDLALAEFDHGDWTEDEIKQQFSPLVKENISICFDETPWVQTSTSSVLGSQPAGSTKYFWVPPLFQSPRIQPVS